VIVEEKIVDDDSVERDSRGRWAWCMCRSGEYLLSTPCFVVDTLQVHAVVRHVGSWQRRRSVIMKSRLRPISAARTVLVVNHPRTATAKSIAGQLADIVSADRLFITVAVDGVEYTLDYFDVRFHS
jgi:predicted lysophospholipase L1 biosynthesis ABC-type transport system permease subunit